MIRYRPFAPIAVGFALFAVSGLVPPALGQPFLTDSQSSVTGSGASEVKRMPQIMRMRIVITSQGKDMTEALAGLKDRLTAAKTQVAALGASKDTIASDLPQVAAENNDRRRQMEMLMAQRMRGGRRPSAKKEDVKPPVSVSSTLTAEWPLKAAAEDGLLLAVTALEDKIKSADLAGLKEQSKLSPEEQELSEELAAEQMAMYSDEGPKPGEPIFMFVAPIQADERDKLLAEGFQKAKEHAARLAKAAGADLGTLRSLADNPIDVSDEMSLSSPYGGGGAYRMMQMMQSARGSLGAESSEAVGLQPGQLTYRVMVTASFELKAK